MRFEFMSGPEDGAVVTIPKEKVFIGRRVSIDGIQLTWDSFVSKRHATVFREAEGFRVADTGNEGKGSTHGTLLCDPCLKPKGHLRGQTAALEAGDILVVGHTWIKFLGD
jgi:pSer/pThr/pTyr-binding forkhead associated (FHA) protein